MFYFGQGVSKMLGSVLNFGQLLTGHVSISPSPCVVSREFFFTGWSISSLIQFLLGFLLSVSFYTVVAMPGKKLYFINIVIIIKNKAELEPLGNNIQSQNS